MTRDAPERRLAAILSADAVGFTRLMAEDDLRTVEALKKHRELIAGLVRQYGGRVVDAVGDSLLAEFPSAVDAVECAIEIQAQLERRNAELPPASRMLFRIGIDVGELIVDGESIAGDGVNIAARIQALAKPGGVAIKGGVLDHVEGKLQIEVEDQGERTLKNVPKPVRVVMVAAAGPHDSRAGTEHLDRAPTNPNVPGFSGRHAIAVLPFQNLAPDLEQEYFADGLAEDLINRLAALRLFPIIARNSSFLYKDKSVDIRDVGRRLGAHYIVTGSVRRAGNRVRVSAALADSEDAHEIWSERYDREISDIFDLQDEITEAIVASVGPVLSRTEIRHAMRRTPQDLDAWDCIHRGIWHLFRVTREHNAQARSWARRALELRPGYSPAFTLLAFSHMYDLTNQWSESPSESRREAVRAAEEAVTLDRDNALALTALGYACSLSGQQDRAIAVLERAIELNPSSALAYWSLGAALAPAGRPDEAIPVIEKAIRLSPRDPLMHEFLFNIGAAHFTR